MKAGASARVEAPYLQLVLERLWEVERERGSDVLRASTLAELGGAERIVEEHLERALAGLDAERARSRRAPLQPPGDAVWDKDRARRRTTSRATPTSRSGTARAGARRARGRPHPAPRPGQERAARRGTRSSTTCSRRPSSRGATATSPAGARRRAQAARRRHRRLGLIAGLALVALAGTLALAVWALAQRSEARDQALSAEARELAASALSQLTVDPERSLRLALEAAELEPSDRTEAVLRRALLDSRVRLQANVGLPGRGARKGTGRRHRRRLGDGDHRFRQRTRGNREAAAAGTSARAQE